jgi:hypothetical protein
LSRVGRSVIPQINSATDCGEAMWGSTVRGAAFASDFAAV